MSDVKPLNIDGVLGKAKNRIALIGVELEGGWTSLPPGVNLVHDGSVRNLVPPPSSGGPSYTADQIEAMVQDRLSRATRGRGLSTRQVQQVERDVRSMVAQELRGGVPLQTGEIPSPVMPPSEVGVWMRRYYPQAVNGTCGLHVHMSFESALHYQRLMVPSYQATILDYVGKWAKEEGLKKDHPIWNRLSGDSRYCQHKFWPDHQVRTRAKDHDQQREGHRYTVINFCYLSNGTVECRLLPMMETADQGVRAVQRVLDITNAFLVKERDRTKARCVVVATEDTHTEVKNVFLSPERRSSELRA